MFEVVALRMKYGCQAKTVTNTRNAASVPQIVVSVLSLAWEADVNWTN